MITACLAFSLTFSGHAVQFTAPEPPVRDTTSISAPAQKYGNGVFAYFDIFRKYKGKILFDNVLMKIKDSGFNILLPQVITHLGYASYKSSILPEDKSLFSGINSGTDPLKSLINHAKKENIKIWGWAELFHGNKKLLDAHPDWFAIGADGKITGYLDFLNPKVQAYTLNALSELSRNYALDGLNLDIEMPISKVSYSENDIKMFDSETHSNVTSRTALENSNAWYYWMNDKLAAFLRTATARIKEANKSIVISYDVTPTPYSYSYYMDFTRWIRDGAKPDVVDPMIYWEDYGYSISFVKSYTAEDVNLLKNSGVDVMTAIGRSYSSGKLSGSEWIKGAKEAISGGSKGILAFSYMAIEEDRALHAFKRYLRGGQESGQNRENTKTQIPLALPKDTRGGTAPAGNSAQNQSTSKNTWLKR